jgi:hypothetical protein
MPVKKKNSGIFVGLWLNKGEVATLAKLKKFLGPRASKATVIRDSMDKYARLLKL